MRYTIHTTQNNAGTWDSIALNRGVTIASAHGTTQEEAERRVIIQLRLKGWE